MRWKVTLTTLQPRLESIKELSDILFKEPELVSSLLAVFFRHEWAQFPQPQHIPNKHQTRTCGDRAEAEWKTVPGRPSWQWEGKTNGKIHCHHWGVKSDMLFHRHHRDNVLKLWKSWLILYLSEWCSQFSNQFSWWRQNIISWKIICPQKGSFKRDFSTEVK